MPHPLLAEFCRASELAPSFVRRCQREFRTQIQPVWDEVVQLRAENARLEAEIAEIRANPPKRKRGRPRKVPLDVQVTTTAMEIPRGDV